MRVVIVSKALLNASYRHKLTELARLGIHVTAVVPTEWREGSTRQRLEPATDDGYDIVASAIRWSGRFHTHYYPRLGAVLRTLRPDLVHMDEEPYNLATYLGVRAARGSGARSLFFSWQNINRAYPFPFRLLEAWVYRHVDGALAGSGDAAHVLRSKGFQQRVTVVPQFGVDERRFSPGSEPEGPFTVGFFNRLIEPKGPFVALDALARTPTDVHMRVVGDGPLRKSIQTQLQQPGLDARVELHARIPSAEMPDLLHSVHVVVLPSLTTPRWKEQFGRVLTEAMSCGIPVIGSDSGEIPNVVGDAGLIVPEGDASALAGAIMRLRTDAGLRIELGQRGRARVLEHFTNARVAELTHSAYQFAVA